VDFNVIEQLLPSSDTGGGKKLEYNKTIYLLLTDYEMIYDFLRREALYNIFIVYGVPMTLVRLIKMCSNEICSRI